MMKLTPESVLVVACDSVGGIGPKTSDRIHVSGEFVGRLTSRVALAETLSVGAKPFLIVATLSVEPKPTAASVIKGIGKELHAAGIDVPILRSTEKNIAVSQTGIGVTVLANVARDLLRVGKSRAGDAIVAIGIPHVGSEVRRGEMSLRIADLRDLNNLSKSQQIHDIIPVGSGGILKEAEVMARDSHLDFETLKPPPRMDLNRSAGPATVLLCSVPRLACGKVQSLTIKPVTKIGALVRSTNG